MPSPPPPVELSPLAQIVAAVATAVVTALAWVWGQKSKATPESLGRPSNIMEQENAKLRTDLEGVLRGLRENFEQRFSQLTQLVHDSHEDIKEEIHNLKDLHNDINAEVIRLKTLEEVRSRREHKP